jgi:Uma2 family endonuclease
VTEHGPDTVRGPGIAFWSAERIPLDVEPEGYPDIPADLCVEILSPDDVWELILEKVREYLTCGVRMVWVVDVELRTVTVYRNADEGRVLHQNATLSGDDVLPGFTIRVGELFN